MWKTTTLRCLFGLLAMALALRSISAGMHGVGRWVPINGTLALAGIACTVLLVSFRAVRWKILLAANGGTIGRRELTSIYGSSFFLGLISPGRVGEATRIWYARHSGASLDGAAASVVIDRIFDVVPTVCVAGAFSIGISLHGSAASLTATRLGAIAAAILLVALVVFPAAANALIRETCRGVTRRLPKAWTLPSPSDRHGQPKLLSRRTIIVALAISSATQMLLFAQALFFGLAVHIDASPMVIFGVITMSAFVASLPVSIGGLGAREAAVAYALVAIGIPTPNAVSFASLSLLNFLVTMSLSAVFFALHPLLVVDRAPRAQPSDRETLPSSA